MAGASVRQISDRRNGICINPIEMPRELRSLSQGHFKVNFTCTFINMVFIKIWYKLHGILFTQNNFGLLLVPVHLESPPMVPDKVGEHLQGI